MGASTQPDEGHSRFVVNGPEARQQVIELDASSARLIIGREGADIDLGLDDTVSRVHAELLQAGPEWLLIDDNMSRNGTFVNGERLAGRHRLRHGDRVRIGATILVFHQSIAGEDALSTRAVEGPVVGSEVTPSQKRVLIALCRPYRGGAAFAVPASNQMIAAELFLSVDAVKTHLRALFRRFAIDDLPQNQKRGRLVELAMQSGIVSEKDFLTDPKQS